MLSSDTSLLSWHPKPMAVNGFGAWLYNDGCYVFNRASDLYRAAFMAAVEHHLQPPPHKKLCVETNVVHGAADETRLQDPFRCSSVPHSVSVPMSSLSSQELLNSQSVIRQCPDPREPQQHLASYSSSQFGWSVQASSNVKGTGPHCIQSRTSFNGYQISLPLSVVTTASSVCQQPIVNPTAVRISGQPASNGQHFIATTTTSDSVSSFKTITVLPATSGIKAMSSTLNGTINPIRKSDVSIVAQCTTAQSSVEARNIAASQSYSILLTTPLAWQFHADASNSRQVISSVPPVSDSTCRMTATSTSGQHHMSGASLSAVERRPTILSKPFRISAASGLDVSLPTSRLLPCGSDTAIHIHHRRKISHHTAATSNTIGTDSNVLS
jgi:hypothetical protein